MTTLKQSSVRAQQAGGGSRAPAKASVRVLSETGRAYAIYVNGGTQAELVIELPTGSYHAEWLNTKTATVDKAETFHHGGGARTLVSPAYSDALLFE